MRSPVLFWTTAETGGRVRLLSTGRWAVDVSGRRSDHLVDRLPDRPAIGLVIAFVEAFLQHSRDP